MGTKQQPLSTRPVYNLVEVQNNQLHYFVFSCVIMKTLLPLGSLYIFAGKCLLANKEKMSGINQNHGSPLLKQLQVTFNFFLQKTLIFIDIIYHKFLPKIHMFNSLDILLHCKWWQHHLSLFKLQCLQASNLFQQCWVTFLLIFFFNFLQNNYHSWFQHAILYCFILNIKLKSEVVH